MRFEFFVARRYLTAKRKQVLVSVISLISILGVGLAVAALILVTGVMNGFSTELRDKILGVNSHMLVSTSFGSLRDPDQIREIILEVPGVLGATPYIQTEMLLGATKGRGVVVRGIDPLTAGTVFSLPKDLLKGRIDDLDPALRPKRHSEEDPEDAERPGVIIGSEMARSMSIDVGSTINLMAPASRMGAAGFMPKIRSFQVVGIFKTGLLEYDSNVVYLRLQDTQELAGLRLDQVTGLDVRVKEVYEVEELGRQISARLGGPPFTIRTWIEMNGELFAALQLEKDAMFIVLVITVMIGAFGIITSLILLVMEKTKDIAVMIAMGATSGMIRRIFMIQGTIIGGIGTALGFALGLPLAWLLQKYRFIKLPSVYPIDHLSIRLIPHELIIIGAVAFLLCFLATVYPARQAARLHPVDALRYE